MQIRLTGRNVGFEYTGKRNRMATATSSMLSSIATKPPKENIPQLRHDKVQATMPKLLAVVLKEPVSFKKYKVTAILFPTLRVLLLRDQGSGET